MKSDKKDEHNAHIWIQTNLIFNRRCKEIVTSHMIQKFKSSDF